MAPQITLLFLELLYGFLCAPIVLIFVIENVEYLVFLTDKTILLLFECISKIVPRTFQCLFSIGAVDRTRTRGTTMSTRTP